MERLAGGPEDVDRLGRAQRLSGMLRAVLLGGVLRVLDGAQLVAVSDVRMVAGGLMVLFFGMLGRFVVVLGRQLEVLGRLLVVFCDGVVVHVNLQSCRNE
jgi:hypothetical protein